MLNYQRVSTCFCCFSTGNTTLLKMWSSTGQLVPHVPVLVRQVNVSLLKQGFLIHWIFSNCRCQTKIWHHVNWSFSSIFYFDCAKICNGPEWWKRKPVALWRMRSFAFPALSDQQHEVKDPRWSSKSNVSNVSKFVYVFSRISPVPKWFRWCLRSTSVPLTPQFRLELKGLRTASQPAKPSTSHQDTTGDLLTSTWLGTYNERLTNGTYRSESAEERLVVDLARGSNCCARRGVLSVGVGQFHELLENISGLIWVIFELLYSYKMHMVQLVVDMIVIRTTIAIIIIITIIVITV